MERHARTKLNFNSVFDVVEDQLTVPQIIRWSPERPAVNGEAMSVVAYVLVTVGVFALLGLAQRALERL
jgi:hypothetical protein